MLNEEKNLLLVEPFLCIIITPTTSSNGLKNIANTSPMLSPFSWLFQGVCLECMVLLGRDFSLCVDFCLEPWGGRFGKYALPPWLRSLLWLLIWLPSGTQPLAPPWLLQILHAIYKLASSCLHRQPLKWKLQLQTFTGLLGSILGKWMTTSFDAVIWNLRIWPRLLGSCAEAWSLSSNAQSKVTAVLAVVREKGLCTNFLKEMGTFSNGWVWGLFTRHLEIKMHSKTVGVITSTRGD